MKKNFKTIKLNEIADLKRGPFGGALKKSIFVPDGYKVYEQKNAIYNDFSLGSYYINSEKYQEMKAFEVIPDDIIMSCSGTIGKLSIAPQDAKSGIINQALLRIRPSKEVYSEYLKLYLESEYIQKRYLLQTSGTAMQNLKPMKVIKEIPINLPDLETQSEILAKIKECFTLLDKSETKLKQAEKKLQDTILSARIKAFISDNTTFKQIGELAEVITKGSTPTSYGYPYIESGINFIKVESIEDQMINQARINCFISEEANNFLSRSKLHEDDILFSIAGTIGKVAIVEKNILPANTNQALAIIRGYKKYFKPKYLYYFLQSAAIEALKEKARGGAMNNISLNDIKSFNIPTTDFETQEKVIQYLEKSESVIKKSLKSIFIKSDQIQTLRQSILKKAFEGKLI